MAARIGPEIEARPQLRHQLVFIAESPKDAAVDILQYGFGAIVLRGWFDDDIRDLLEPLEPLFFADDVLFSGYLASKGVQRICIAGMPLPRAARAQGHATAARRWARDPQLPRPPFPR